jgi:hypothetical protein
MDDARTNTYQMYVGLHVQYRLYLSRFLMKLNFSRQTFEKYLSIKFHENLLGGNQIVPCEVADRQIWHDEGNSHSSKFSNAPKKKQEPHTCLFSYKQASENKITRNPWDRVCIILHLG